MRDAAQAWLATAGRVYMAASAVAVAALVHAVPDFPLAASGVGGTLLILLLPAVATFGGLWRAPARWVFFVGPIIVLGAGFALARLALAAPSLLADLPAPDSGLVTVLLLPTVFVMIPGALVGTALAAMSLSR